MSYLVEKDNYISISNLKLEQDQDILTENSEEIDIEEALKLNKQIEIIYNPVTKVTIVQCDNKKIYVREAHMVMTPFGCEVKIRYNYKSDKLVIWKEFIIQDVNIYSVSQNIEE